MARLNIEHYRTNASMTPEHIRKSSRLMNIFKSRSTSNNSIVDPSTRSPPANSPFSPPVSPTSPTVKPGFEQVGLLPSEQGSIMDVKATLEQNGGTRAAEVLEKQVQEPEGVGIPHNANTKLDVDGADHVDEFARLAKEEKRGQEVNEIAATFKNTVSKGQDKQDKNEVHVESAESSANPQSTTRTPFHSLRRSNNRQEQRAEKCEISSTKAHGKPLPV
jgi:hypothetical protein